MLWPQYQSVIAGSQRYSSRTRGIPSVGTLNVLDLNSEYMERSSRRGMFCREQRKLATEGLSFLSRSKTIDNVFSVGPKKQERLEYRMLTTEKCCSSDKGHCGSTKGTRPGSDVSDRSVTTTRRVASKGASCNRTVGTNLFIGQQQ